MSTIKLACECGKIQGEARDITPNSGNHVVCCCIDCQAFANYLDKGDTVLDECGGTRIYQTSQSQVKIGQGIEHIICLKLTQKGITRWYSACCNTPIGNTLNAKMPFIGLVHSFMQHSPDLAQNLGPVRAYVQTQYAIKTPTYLKHSAKFPLGITLRIVRKILSWKIRKMGQPSVFYDAQGKVAVKPIIVN